MRPFDLYRAPLVGPLLRNRGPQQVLQLSLAAGYGVIAVLGWGRDGIPGIPELHPRLYTHATTLLFWIVWFMGLVLLAPVLGRAWCGACPLGAAADFLGRRGLGLPWPRWLVSGRGMLVVFVGGVAAVLWGEATKSPHRTAVFIAAVAAAAVLSGLVWRRGAFCKGLCPVGSALHLYSRHAPLAVQPIDPEGCRRCTDRSCTDRKGSWHRWGEGNLVVQHRVFRSGCPVALYPPAMDPGACLLCLRCVRQCSRGNLGVLWGRAVAAPGIDSARSCLLVLLSGLVTLALLRTWPEAKGALTPGVFPPVWWSGLWLGVGLPAALLVGPGVLSAVVSWSRGTPVEPPGPEIDPPRAPFAQRCRTGVGATVRRCLPAFVGPVLGAHAVLALVKLNAKLAYVPYLAYDPSGVSTYLAIHVARALPVPDLLVPLGWLRWSALGCLVLGVVAGVRTARQTWRCSAEPVAFALYALSFAALSTLLSAATVHWLFPWGR
ncbi:MAG: 4Fe-4S binding protein [Deltaproteobacteria bacterium]|nr:4Fe-4S binding protein [Deltaproteobacteria bacterium]